MTRLRDPVDLNAVRWAIRNGRPVVVPDIDVAVCAIEGHPFCFASDRLEDPVQRQNRNGMFYEEEELALIKTHLLPAATFVDIGANVGNHSLFVAAFLNPEKIIPFEPNPLAYKLLLANIVMNGFNDLFDLRHIGVGLSDAEASGYAMTNQTRNLGGARMLAGAGDIATITGDAALADEMPNFLKIDVEGMEMLVLAGLEKTISRCAPMILIEVDEANYTAFDTWTRTHDYEVLDEIQRYRMNKNFLVRKRTES
jgi:FkbM family methyltransferase